MLSAVATNRPFTYILAAKLLQLVGLAASSASMLFLIKDVIRGNENLLAVFGVTANLMSIVSMAFWPAIGRHFGKIPVYAVSVAGFAAVGFTWLLADQTTTTATVFARALVSGTFVGGLLLMGQSLIPDAISEDWYRNGLRREGVFAAAYSFVEKTASALGPMIVGVMFQLLGFRPSAPVETQSMVPIYIAAGVIPASAYLLSAVPVLRIRFSAPAAAAATAPASARR
jgi:GPH family glycoside/pentoside/hexuronide:cation symporter